MNATLESAAPESPAAPSGFSRVAFGGLTAALNHLIASENWARERLRAHAGKTAHVLAPPLDLTLVVMSDGLVAAAGLLAAPDVRLTVDWAGLPDTARNAVGGDGPPLDEALLRHVHVAGDADFASTIGLLLRHVRWDVEDDLSRVLGDALAYRVVSGGRKAGAGLRDGARRVAANVVEYLSEEQPFLVPRARYDAVRDDIRALQAEVERLDARLAALLARTRR